MKTSLALTAIILPAATAFAPAFVNRNVGTQRSMFGGGGDGAVMEDDPEKMEQIEKAAKSMGMSVEEYQLGMSARIKFENEIGDMRLKAGDDDIGVESDGKSPPTHLVVTISDAGKAKGPDALSKELAAAFKKTADDAKVGRADAQKNMMAYIQESMK